MKKQLLFIAGVLIGFTTQAQCTITPNCTPAGNGYCTVPAQNSTLQPDAEVNSNYSTVIQFNTESTFGGAPINLVTITAATLPSGLSIEFNPQGTSSTEGTIVGGQAGCATISGIPTQVMDQQEVVLDIIADVGGNLIPLTATFYIDVNASTASLLETSEKSFALFPNPANSKVQISVNTPTTLIISDVLGNIIQEVDVNSSISLPVIDWKNGLYLITSEESGETMKFIKY